VDRPGTNLDRLSHRQCKDAARTDRLDKSVPELLVAARLQEFLQGIIDKLRGVRQGGSNEELFQRLPKGSPRRVQYPFFHGTFSLAASVLEREFFFCSRGLFPRSSEKDTQKTSRLSVILANATRNRRLS
jgi:hypothetical protein